MSATNLTGRFDSITPPADSASKQPDASTAGEVQVIGKKPMTAAERAEEANLALREKLSNDVEHHKNECERLKSDHKGEREVFKQEIDELQVQLVNEQKRIEAFIERCKGLEGAAKASGCMGFWTVACNVGSATLLAIAGTVPGINETVRVILITAGTALALAVLVLGSIGWYLGPTKRPSGLTLNPPS